MNDPLSERLTELEEELITASFHAAERADRAEVEAERLRHLPEALGAAQVRADRWKSRSHFWMTKYHELRREIDRLVDAVDGPELVIEDLRDLVRNLDTRHHAEDGECP